MGIVKVKSHFQHTVHPKLHIAIIFTTAASESVKLDQSWSLFFMSCFHSIWVMMRGLKELNKGLEEKSSGLLTQTEGLQHLGYHDYCSQKSPIMYDFNPCLHEETPQTYRDTFKAAPSGKKEKKPTCCLHLCLRTQVMMLYKASCTR